MNEPFTTSEDIVRHGYDYVRVNAQKIRRIVTLRTSGSTGAAKRLFFSENDLRRTIDFFRDGMAHIAVPDGVCAIILGSKSPDGLGRLLEQGLTELGCHPVLYGIPEDYEAAASFLLETQPDTVIGLPVQLRRLALMTPTLRPKTVLMSGDRAAECVKGTVSRLWNAVVYDHYGITEGGLGFAVQCSLRQGMHVRTDEFSVEIIDPKTGNVLPDGQWGEIVFTTLRREAMPLMRYRTGDISRILPGICPCGNPGIRLDGIRGRLSELEKPISIYALDELLFPDDEIYDFQAVLCDNDFNIYIDGSLSAICRAKDSLQAQFPDYRLLIRQAHVLPTAEKRCVRIGNGDHVP